MVGRAEEGWGLESQRQGVSCEEEVVHLVSCGRRPLR